MKNYYDMLLTFVSHSIQTLIWEALWLLILRVNDVSEFQVIKKVKIYGTRTALLFSDYFYFGLWRKDERHFSCYLVGVLVLFYA